MHEIYIKELESLCIKAFKNEEVPVAALIIKDNKILSKAYNRRNKNKNLLGHAEVIAIEKACNKLNDWRLNGCIMYVTLKPCKMCEYIIKESRIEKVYYLADNNKITDNNTKFIELKETEKFRKILTSFFKQKR